MVMSRGLKTVWDISTRSRLHNQLSLRNSYEDIQKLFFLLLDDKNRKVYRTQFFLVYKILTFSHKIRRKQFQWV